MDDFEAAVSVEGEALPGRNGEQETHEAPEALVDETSDALDENTDLEEQRGSEDEFEEIERNGRRATIPAWLKPELMMQADYTRKTQELADARRTFEAEQREVQEFSQAELSAHANLASINQQLAHYSKVDWSAWNRSDPAAAQAQFARFQMLQNAQRETTGQLANMRAYRTNMAQQESAQRLAEGLAELQRDVDGWSPDMAAELKQFGQSRYGFTDKDLDEVDDPRAIKVLHAAYQWEQHQARQRQVQRHAAAQGVRPAAKVGAAAPKHGLDDRLSAEEWTRRRNNQVRRRG